jgi:hypothetical protein
LFGGGPAHLVTDRPVAGDSHAGRSSCARVDVGEQLGSGPAHLVADRLVASDG